MYHLKIPRLRIFSRKIWLKINCMRCGGQTRKNRSWDLFSMSRWKVEPIRKITTRINSCSLTASWYWEMLLHILHFWKTPLWRWSVLLQWNSFLHYKTHLALDKNDISNYKKTLHKSVQRCLEVTLDTEFCLREFFKKHFNISIALASWVCLGRKWDIRRWTLPKTTMAKMCA